jgi:hypothetical protein
MLELIHDPAVGVNFAVLIIARLRLMGIQLSATLFRQRCQPELVEVVIEGIETKVSLMQRVLRIFRRAT